MTEKPKQIPTIRCSKCSWLHHDPRILKDLDRAGYVNCSSCGALLRVSDILQRGEKIE